MSIFRFSRSLEQTVIDVLAQYSVVGQRSEVNTGVWIGPNKVSPQGVTASRWITMHGVAVNVNVDLNYFDKIVPCGIHESRGGVCNLQDHISPQRVNIADFSDRWIKSFENIFNLDVDIRDNSIDELDALSKNEVSTLEKVRILDVANSSI